MSENSNRALSLSLQCYRGLLRAYPQPFLAAFEDLMLQAFADLAHRAVRTQGTWGLFVLWIRSIPDVMSSALREHFRSSSDWSFRLRWILACSMAISTPYTLIFLQKFMPRGIGTLFQFMSRSTFATFEF